MSCGLRAAEAARRHHLCRNHRQRWQDHDDDPSARCSRRRAIVVSLGRKPPQALAARSCGRASTALRVQGARSRRAGACWPVAIQARRRHRHERRLDHFSTGAEGAAREKVAPSRRCRVGPRLNADDAHVRGGTATGACVILFAFRRRRGRAEEVSARWPIASPSRLSTGVSAGSDPPARSALVHARSPRSRPESASESARDARRRSPWSSPTCRMSVTTLESISIVQTTEGPGRPLPDVRVLRDARASRRSVSAA
jgi:hypothetical protein